ncbi:toxin-antitoxin system YwqK family antitoxin [Fusobacterium varium]|uniref:toxin-antitoxin system YwqK family antitoxin n=1 Tax=Fusobacterium varium TaxID=856 RepID=UPI00242D5597|nr:toxin-antitoxin system YwqK family antitoxin [Fusobacterium varium]
MKKKLILLILIMINLISCREKIVKIDEIEEKIEVTKTSEGVIDRILYKKGEDKPFTGKIVKDFENDDISFEINVKNGKKDGVSISYYYPKRIKIKEIYKNGKLDGNRRVYYMSGKIKSEEIYENGTPINEAKYYYEDEQVKKIVDYKNKIIKMYYRDGALYRKVKFLGNSEWNYEGEAKLYFQTGEILGIEEFKNGTLDGKSVYYYKNGNIHQKGYYKNGGREGEYIIYYENGNMEEKTFYQKGALKNGRRITYYENGNIRTESFHDNQGLYHGEVKKYYENGKVKVIEIYEHGKFISKKEF